MAAKRMKRRPRAAVVVGAWLRLFLVLVIAAALAIAAAPFTPPAIAASTRQADSAVKRVIHRKLPDLKAVRPRCQRLTRRRWGCDWTALDVLGEPCNGSASAIDYPYAWKIVVRVESGSDYCYP